jgi:hypothetical protein
VDSVDELWSQPDPGDTQRSHLEITPQKSHIKTYHYRGHQFRGHHSAATWFRGLAAGALSEQLLWGKIGEVVTVS